MLMWTLGVGELHESIAPQKRIGQTVGLCQCSCAASLTHVLRSMFSYERLRHNSTFPCYPTIKEGKIACGCDSNVGSTLGWNILTLGPPRVEVGAVTQLAFNWMSNCRQECAKIDAVHTKQPFSSTPRLCPNILLCYLPFGDGKVTYKHNHRIRGYG
jgi:hypothetical protein